MKLIPGKLYKVVNNTTFNHFHGEIPGKMIRQQFAKFDSFYLNNEIILFVKTICEKNCWDDIYDIWVFMHKGEYVECAPTYMPEKMFIETSIEASVEKCN